MSYTNSTTHYGLPLPTGSDKSLFTDTNQAFQDIDAAIYTAETVATQAGTDITAIKATIVNLQNADITFQNDISGLQGRMTAVEGVASQNTTDIADVRSDAEDMITAYNEPTATSAHAYAIGDEFIYNDVLYRATAAIAISDTIVPNTNCAATNVMTEINQVNSDLKYEDFDSYTADGTESYAQLLTRVYNGSFDKLSIRSKIDLGGLIANITSVWNGGVTCYGITLSGTNIVTDIFTIAASPKLYEAVGTSTVTDNSSNVPSAGTTIKVYY